MPANLISDSTLMVSMIPVQVMAMSCIIIICKKLHPMIISVICAPTSLPILFILACGRDTAFIISSISSLISFGISVIVVDKMLSHGHD